MFDLRPPVSAVSREPSRIGAFVSSPAILVAFTVALVTSVLLFLIVSEVLESRHNVLHETALRLETSARINGEHASRLLQEAESALSDVSLNIADGIFNDRSVPLSLSLVFDRRLDFLPQLAGLAFYDRDGRLDAYSGNVWSGASSRNIEKSSLFIRHRDGWVPSQLARSTDVISALGNASSFGLSVMAVDEAGNFSGVSLAIFQLRTFEEFFSESQGVAAIALALRDGEILAGWDHDRGRMHSGQALVSQAAFTGFPLDTLIGSGTRLVEGETFIGATFQLPRYAAHVVVVQSLDNALAGWRKTLPRAIALSLLLIGLATVSAAFLYVMHRRRTEGDLVLRLRERAMQASPEGIFIVNALDDQHSLVYVNPALERLTGRMATSVLNHGSEVLFGSAAQPFLPQETSQIEAGADADLEVTIEVPGVAVDGHQFLAAVTVAPVRNRQQKVTHFVGFVRDISESRAAENELEARTHDLERSNEELEQFAYVASHDLQEPLRMVSSFLQLLNRRYSDSLDAQGREFITFAVDGAERMYVLINDLLEYSRVGRKGQPLTPTPLSAVLAIAVENLSVAIREAEGSVTIASDMPTVLGDDRELMRVFQNVIGNAIKYRAPDRAPKVVISCEEDGQDWVIQVADNGIGIEASHFKRIFMIFQRLHGRDAYSGTGIGLAVVKKIVERHGGRVVVSSVAGEGSVFSIYIPKMT